MLEIDKTTHKIKIESIDNKEDARAYVNCMRKEIKRHKDAIEVATWDALEIYKMPIPKEPSLATMFWGSAIKRHDKDIEQAQILVGKVKNKWGIE